MSQILKQYQFLTNDPVFQSPVAQLMRLPDGGKVCLALESYRLFGADIAVVCSQILEL